MDNVILTQATKEDIISEITNNVLSGVSALLKESRQSELNSKENWTPKETEQYLKITGVTRWSWTKAGILKSYKIGGRLRYKKNEVMEALIQIESKRKKA